MELIKTAVYQDKQDVKARLADLGLTLDGLLEVRDRAVNDSSNATPFHALNAAGTFAYHSGTWALRHVFVDNDNWVVDRSDGIESIWNQKLNVRVAFSNVDKACGATVPQPRSKKGAGAERAVGGGLFPNLPRYAPKAADGSRFYYLMVDSEGAVELTIPVVSAGSFVDAHERIYLSSGIADEDDVLVTTDDSLEFEPQVVRK